MSAAEAGPGGRALRVAMFHTRYTQAGGEDRSTRQEVELLRRHGHAVDELTFSNAEVLERGTAATVAALWRAPFNRASYERVRAFCRRHRPDVAHVQNFWFALSPSVHAACHAEGVATVQTLRNYRLLCVNAYLLRDGAPCEDCVGRAPWPGVLHRCYRDSALQSALVARMILHNRRRRTWRRDADLLVALTESARHRFVRGGLPEDRLVVRPNFAPDPGPPTPGGRGALYLGRLSDDKGIDLLLAAHRRAPEVPLAIAGDGPLRPRVEAAAAEAGGPAYLGRLSALAVQEALGRHAFLVMASRWYEGLPRVLVEAFAAGRAAVTPRLGAMAEVVRDGDTGLLYAPGDADALAAALSRLHAEPAAAEAMGRRARAEYLERYSPAAAYPSLVAHYAEARRRWSARHEAVP